MATYEADFSQWIESAVFDGVVGAEKLIFVSLEDVSGLFDTLFENAPAQSTLASAASAGASTLDLVDATTFPIVSDPLTRAVEIIIDEADPNLSERINYESKTGNTLNLFGGSQIANSHAIGATVRVINRYVQTNTLTSFGGQIVKYDNLGTLYGDVEVHFSSGASTVLLAGIVARYSEDGMGNTTGYAFLVGRKVNNYGGYIYKISGSGVLTLLDSSPQFTSLSTQQRYKAVLSANNLAMFRYDTGTNSWVQIVGVVDASYSTGKIGAMAWQQSGQIFRNRLDNIEVYSLV